jgi:16S rRNA (guanine527-N7)-methyltransferase
VSLGQNQGPTVAAGSDASVTVREAVFGERLPLASRYADLLAGDGVAHGMIGPRERDRLWDRHLINSALVTELLPGAARVVDVGSGAGLPGLAMACRRDDLEVVLLESMQRRIEFVQSCIVALDFGSKVSVLHSRVESPAARSALGRVDWMTARAVAPLDRLASWCLPLLGKGGRLSALKGARAHSEVAEHSVAVRRAGGLVEDVVQCGVGLVAEPTVVVIVRRI